MMPAGWACVQWLHLPASGFSVVVALSLAAYAAIIGGAIRLGGWAR